MLPDYVVKPLILKLPHGIAGYLNSTSKEIVSYKKNFITTIISETDSSSGI